MKGESSECLQIFTVILLLFLKGITKQEQLLSSAYCLCIAGDRGTYKFYYGKTNETYYTKYIAQNFVVCFSFPGFPDLFCYSCP